MEPYIAFVEYEVDFLKKIYPVEFSIPCVF